MPSSFSARRKTDSSESGLRRRRKGGLVNNGGHVDIRVPTEAVVGADEAGEEQELGEEGGVDVGDKVQRAASDETTVLNGGEAGGRADEAGNGVGTRRGRRGG